MANLLALAGGWYRAARGSLGMAQRLPKDERRLVRYSQLFDATRNYFTDQPTAQKFSSYMKAIDAGDVAIMVELTEEMESKDAHLQGVAETRRRAVTALDWEIVPGDGDERDAKLAADYVSRQLGKIVRWPEALEHLADAIGPNVSVLELVWRGMQLIDIGLVPGHRLITDIGKGTSVRILTDESMVWGESAYRDKWVVYHPNTRGGYPFRVTLTRTNAILYLLKHFAQADWAAFSEVFGMPVRTARVKSGATTAERVEVFKMLRDMSADAVGVFSDDVQLEFHEVARGTQPYEAMIQWVEKKQSILWLGQTLTTDIGDAGSRAAATVHDNVRKDLLMSDVRKEARCIEWQIFEPMVRFRFPSRSMPTPRFLRRLVEYRNVDVERLAMEQIRLAREMGLTIDENWAYETLNIPIPKLEAQHGG